jgi:hypothetical protein
MKRVPDPRRMRTPAVTTPEETYVALLAAHEARRHATDAVLVARMAAPR